MAGALPSVQPPAPTPLQQPNPLINPPGMVEPGNLDPFHRRTLDNKNGTFSTTLSFSVGTDKGETLIPQVVKGQLLTKREAIAHYMKTGQHLGIFDSPQSADAYSSALHDAQGQLMLQGATNIQLPQSRYRGSFQPEQGYVPSKRTPGRPLTDMELQDMRAKR